MNISGSRFGDRSYRRLDASLRKFKGGMDTDGK